MATRHTEHYQLNLWESSDKFIRTEFNENSAKIDTALTAHDDRMNTLQTGLDTKSSYTLIRTVPATTRAMSQFSVDVSGIDWSQWERVVLRCRLLGSGSAYARIKDGDGACCYCPLCASSIFGGSLGYLYLSSTARYFDLILTPGKLPDRTVETHLLGPGIFTYGYSEAFTFSRLTAFEFFFQSTSSGGTFSAGCSAKVLGMR